MPGRPEFNDHMRAWSRIVDRLCDMGWTLGGMEFGVDTISTTMGRAWRGTGYVRRTVKVFERFGANQYGIWAREGDVSLFIKWV